MNAADAYAALRKINRPLVASGEAAVAWGQTNAATTKMLGRLAGAGLIERIRPGLWAVGELPDPLDAGYFLTRPYPCYGSTWTALFRHGLIEQIPSSIQLVSLDRAQNIATSVGRFSVQHVHPDLYGGFERSGWHDLATPEKALFDTVYLLSARYGRDVSVPEINLPAGFSEARVLEWVQRIPSQRLHTLTSMLLEQIVARAEREAGPPQAVVSRDRMAVDDSGIGERGPL